MSEVYVTGHQNPDTDSIVAAIAYARLRQSLGDRHYLAARIGAVNDETQRLLDRFHEEPPMLLKTMRTQVCDLDYDRPPLLNASVTIDLAWRTMRSESLSAVPIVTPEGRLYGMLTAADIADYNLSTIGKDRIEQLPLFNLLSVIEGQLINEGSTGPDRLSGEIFITMPQNYEEPALTSPGSILICGNQPELIDRAVEAGVSCLILCRADIKPEWRDVCSSTYLISTPYNTRQVARLIYQAPPVSSICHTGDLVVFKETDLIDDVSTAVLKNRYHSYPVVDAEGAVLGTLSRFHLLRPRRKQVVLVDHNEVAQSVPGLEETEILEIIDHHRLGDIQTIQPIRVRNEPVGSSNTIIASMYQEKGVVPAPKIAGLMAGAILSDTVFFKSPTCTRLDMVMAERMAHIAGITLEELGKSLFSAVNPDKSAEELLKTDYKQFHIAGQHIAVGQITCGGADQLEPRRDEFLEIMHKEQELCHYDMVLLMITDVLAEGTHLLYVGSDEVVQQAFTLTPEHNHLFLPGVMSRKKQIIPMLTALWG